MFPIILFTFISLNYSVSQEQNINVEQKEIKVIGLIGDSGKMNTMGITKIAVPSNITARIQEVHVMVFHIICRMIDIELFGK